MGRSVRAAASSRPRRGVDAIAPRRRRARPVDRRYLAYIVGACLFNVNTAASIFPEPPKEVVWLPAIAGSFLFAVGGILECVHNHVVSKFEGSHAQWLSLCNAAGGVLFLAASIAGYLPLESETEDWAVNLLAEIKEDLAFAPTPRSGRVDAAVGLRVHA